MSVDRRKVLSRRDRLALVGLKVALAMVFAALGSGLLSPRAAADLARVGLGPMVVLLLGASHFAVAALLLAPGLAAGTIFTMGSTAVWLVAANLPRGPFPALALPLLLTLALFLLLVGSWMRNRAEASAWNDMLIRYAEGGEPSDRSAT